MFGFTGAACIAPGNVADLNVFALDELTYGGDEFVHDLPQGGVRMRRPTGGYRTTLLGGTVVQEHGERTGALPGARHQLDRVADTDVDRIVSRLVLRRGARG